MSETLIKVENVSKKFCRDLKRSLWYGMRDIGSELLGGKNGSADTLRKDEFWAVKDVSFELERGECLGLIGHNGAGKSTLLKMLNGLIKPDSGSISMRGRVGALIELGAGFNPILTGRENVYINGAVLGFSKMEIDKKFDAIVDFAEMENFINTPVQNYSSGMKVRLGFAVASQLEPDVLIIDEVLAVGDAAFRIKSFNFIMDLLAKSAIIFVSHSMQQVARICDKALLLRNGRVSKYEVDGTSLAIQMYYERNQELDKRIYGNGELTLICFKINTKLDRVVEVRADEPISIEIDMQSSEEMKDVVCKIAFFDQELKGVAQIHSISDNISFDLNKGYNKIKIATTNAFNNGLYSLNFGLFENGGKLEVGKTIFKIDNVVSIKVTGTRTLTNLPITFAGVWALET